MINCENSLTYNFNQSHFTAVKRLCFLLIAVTLFSSHTLFLKLDTYFLRPNTSATIKLFNGAFDKSENTIDRDRMIDVSLVGNGNRSRIDTAQWSEANGATILRFNTGEAGTWVAGVSTRARNIEMAADDFNNYLEHDGVLDMLDWRKKNNALDQDAIEKYAKHVKTIFQVGDKQTDDWQTALGYPIEFIPLENPYDLHPGHGLQVELLWQGKPLANQLVYIGTDGADHDHEHEHDHTAENEEDHHHDSVSQARTNADGIFTVDITNEGIWHLRTIHLVQSEEAGLTHESNWATLTFEIGHGHSHAEGTHSHNDSHQHPEDENWLGIPNYAYWLGSLLVLGGLFFFFNRKAA